MWRLYFPAHQMSWPDRLRCTPLPLFVEYLVYRVDAVTERAAAVDLDAARDADYRRLHRYRERFERLLRRAGAYNAAVAREIDNGERYVRLENRVTSHRAAGHQEVLRLAELRPSDVRLLHGMTFALLRRPPDEPLLRLLWPVEVLADIGNDLAHYRADRAAGRFNTYAALVALHGRRAPDRLGEEIARYERMFHDRLADLPAHRRAALRALCERRYRSALADPPPPRDADVRRDEDVPRDADVRRAPERAPERAVPRPRPGPGEGAPPPQPPPDPTSPGPPARAPGHTPPPGAPPPGRAR